jgi:hypothetical protein
MVALAAGCTNPAEFGGNFQITHHNDHIVFGTFTELGATQAWGPSDLEPVPTDVSANRVRYLNAASHRTEAHVFLQDPQAVYDALSGVYSFSDFEAEAPFFGVGVTYPPPPSINLGPPASGFGVPFNDVDLTPTMFGQSGPAGTQVGCLTSLSGESTCALHAARRYDRGDCSTEVAIADIGSSIADGVGCGFANTIAGLNIEVASGSANGVDVASVLTHAPGHVSDAHGGLAVLGSFTETWEALGATVGHTNVHRWDEYLFDLSNDGFLVLKHQRGGSEAPGSGVQYSPGTVTSKLASAMTSQVPSTFAKSAKLEQEVPIPNSLTDTTSYQTCSTVSDCFKCASPGGDPQTCPNPPNLIKTGLRVAQNSRLITSTELRALLGVIADHNNWACAADEPPGPGPGYECPGSGMSIYSACAVPCSSPSPKVCRLILPAERLNVYPDQVELVWYEHNERPMTTPFALSMALAGGGLLAEQPLQQMLCSGQAPNWSTNPDDCLGQHGGCFDTNWYSEQSSVATWRPNNTGYP